MKERTHTHMHIFQIDKSVLKLLLLAAIDQQSISFMEGHSRLDKVSLGCHILSCFILNSTRCNDTSHVK